MRDINIGNIEISKQQLAHLSGGANGLGATASAIISSKEIEVADHLAALCNGDYICPNYGPAANCPPNAEGQVALR